ncbi:helix-turn-helix transcriptional regulator [Halomonas campisalis]|uniref:Helix-turn-helix transcriptional regulator n=1 Tax=Billgrantia campisalis TaxID=74661 RepID=A0ABS9P6N4_9GAMM|nr:helix-turn-helix transcriptional regulator [Halomonas campisalis]MCG6657430.1 helix-turn-helix transcriptional regulator [Halomonas campisalis]MDR5863225.1 helix-turn-helix transcriptional regulator [Halomonas campisalis]
MNSLGPRIKQLRLQANLNKAALARKVGVSDVTISYWESGAIKQIGHERLVALAEALGCPLSRLLEGDYATPPSPLLLLGRPPLPWLDPAAHRVTLHGHLLPAGTDWPGECYLVTPGPGERFEFLADGDLAAICPTTAFEGPGRYLIEGQDGLFISALTQGANGELLASGESSLSRQNQPLEQTDRLVGKLLVRWRPEAG